MFHVKHKRQAPRLGRFGLLTAIAVFGIFASACVGIATADGWPGLAQTDDDFLVTQVDRGRVAAIDPTDGRQLWLFPDQLPGGAIDPANDDIELGSTYATPVIDGNAIYLVSYDGLAVRVEVSDGRIEVAWYAELNEEVVATPLLANGTLYVPTDTGAVISLDAETGGIERRFPVSNGRIWGQPVLQGNVLYLSDLDERATFALDLDTGSVLWEQGLTASSPADLVLDGNLLIVGSFDRALHALDITAGGDERWRFQGDGWFVGPPRINGETLYAATMRGTVYALDRNGNEIWSYTVEDEEFRASPLLIDDVVVVASRDGLVLGLDADTGAQRWESIVEGVGVNAHGLQLNSSVYFITTDHELLRVDATNGAVQRFSVAR